MFHDHAVIDRDSAHAQDQARTRARIRATGGLR